MLQDVSDKKRPVTASLPHLINDENDSAVTARAFIFPNVGISSCSAAQSGLSQSHERSRLRVVAGQLRFRSTFTTAFNPSELAVLYRPGCSWRCSLVDIFFLSVHPPSLTFALSFFFVHLDHERPFPFSSFRIAVRYEQRSLPSSCGSRRSQYAPTHEDEVIRSFAP